MWLLHRLLSWSIWNVGLHNCQSNTTFWEHILKNTTKLHFVSNFKTENCFKTWYQVNKRTFYFIQTSNITPHTWEQKKNTVSNNSFIIISKHWRKLWSPQEKQNHEKTSFLFSVFRFWQLQGREAPYAIQLRADKSLFSSQGCTQLLGCQTEVKMGL